MKFNSLKCEYLRVSNKSSYTVFINNIVIQQVPQANYLNVHTVEPLYSEHHGTMLKCPYL